MVASDTNKTQSEGSHEAATVSPKRTFWSWRVRLGGLSRFQVKLFWQQATLYWKLFSSSILSLAAVGIVVLVAALLVQQLLQRSITIEPISVPSALADNGYTPTVAVVWASITMLGV